MFGTRHETVLNPAKETMAVLRDEVVNPIEQGGRQRTEQSGGFPRPAERCHDEDGGACPGEAG